MGVDIVQDAEAGDGYAIDIDARRAVLAGNDAGTLRGSAYAVYDLLEQLGCGWFGPDASWQVIPKCPSIHLPIGKSDERPAFAYRDIWAVGKLSCQPLMDAWRMGGRRINSGHAFENYVPKAKYLADHPDWFAAGGTQPCLTSPDVQRMVVEKLRERLDREPGVGTFSLSANDNETYCECARCRAVGDISARSLNFANGVARELARTHPGRYILTFYAYWMTHDAPVPMIKAEPGVHIMMVNEGNHMQPWDAPEPESIRRLDRNDNNYREVVAFEGWRKTGGLTGIYEWWIPVANRPAWKVMPWYSGETALRNLRYWRNGGIRYVTYQSGMENGNGFPLRWPLYYIGARGLWNPDRTSAQIMGEACRKLYGPAAEPMQEFYATIERAMVDTGPNLRGFAWKLPGPEDIYRPAFEEQASAALARALTLVTEGAPRGRIEQEKAMWDNARQAIAKARVNPEAPTPTTTRAYN